MNTIKLIQFYFITILIVAPSSLFAASNLENLEKEANLYLQSYYQNAQPNTRIIIKLNPISRKIKLKSCLKPLQFQNPRGNGTRITFRAYCFKPSWNLFLTAQVQQFGFVIVSRITIPAKSAITSRHLMLKEVNLTAHQTAHFSEPSEIIGWTTKRSIAAGTIITASMLKQPVLISRNDAVIIEAIRHGITIRTAGTALEEGVVDKQIRIRNDRSGRVIKAIVIEKGLVRVP